MSALYNRIDKLCKEKGIKGGKMCADIGMSKGILTDLKMGRQTSISSNNAQKIASYFGVTVGYLLGEEETVTNISYLQALNKLNELVQDKEFVELYEAYKKLDDKNKKIVRGLIEDLKA